MKDYVGYFGALCPWLDNFPGLQGEAGKTEDRRHRAFYHTLPDSEAKLQFFAARQIACRILGSHGYLCEHVSFRKLL